MPESWNIFFLPPALIERYEADEGMDACNEVDIGLSFPV
jgi:hypothetical protein